MDHRLSERLVPLGGGFFRTQRYFSEFKVQEALDAALDTLDDSAGGVIVRGLVDDETIASVVAAKGRDKRWSVGLLGEFDRRTGNKRAGFEVRFSW
jgi:hypothetical protein